MIIMKKYIKITLEFIPIVPNFSDFALSNYFHFQNLKSCPSGFLVRLIASGTFFECDQHE